MGVLGEHAVIVEEEEIGPRRPVDKNVAAGRETHVEREQHHLVPLPLQFCVVATGALVEFAVVSDVDRCSWVPRSYRIDQTAQARRAHERLDDYVDRWQRVGHDTDITTGL